MTVDAQAAKDPQEFYARGRAKIERLLDTALNAPESVALPMAAKAAGFGLAEIDFAIREFAALAARLEAAEAEGYDAGQAAIWDEIVCSVCGRNHDRDESAACEGCEAVAFSEWAASAGARLEAAETARDEAERWWRSIIGDAIFGLRHQPELTREQIAEALVNALAAGRGEHG